MKYNILKFTNALFLGVLVALMGACDLDEGSKGVVSPESYYSTESGVENGLIGLYGYYHRNLGDASLFKDKLAGHTGGDDITAPVVKDQFTPADQFYMTGGSAELQTVYEFHYRAILACNELIGIIDPANFSEEFYNNAIGNARFLRGIMYLELVNMFGEVPMMLIAEVNEEIEKSSVETVLKEVVIPDLTFAKDHVINNERDTPASVAARSINGRASKTAAKAYLAKAYMALAGWPVKEDTQANWDSVKANTGEIIEAGAYSLLDDYAHNFGYLGEPGPAVQPWEGNEEAIWSRICNANQAAFYGTRSRYYGAFWLEWMDFLIEWQFYDRMPDDYRTGYSATDGAEWSYLGFTNWKYSNDYAHPTIMKFFWGGMQWDIYRKAKGYPRGSVEEDYPDFIGFEHDYENSADIPEMRYAEVVLMYAEACARTGDNAEATEKLNWVRRRAYAGGLPAVKDTIDYEISVGNLNTKYWMDATPAVDYPQTGESDLIDAIVNERSFEFMGELGGVRWFDITRLEIVEEVTSLRDSRELDLIGDPSDRSTWRMPIPSSESDFNPNL